MHHSPFYVHVILYKHAYVCTYAKWTHTFACTREKYAHIQTIAHMCVWLISHGDGIFSSSPSHVSYASCLVTKLQTVESMCADSLRVFGAHVITAYYTADLGARLRWSTPRGHRHNVFVHAHCKCVQGARHVPWWKGKGVLVCCS